MNLLKTIPRKWLKTGLAAVLIVAAAFLYLSETGSAYNHAQLGIILSEDIEENEVAEGSESVVGDEFAGESGANAGNGGSESHIEVSTTQQVSSPQPIYVHVCGEVLHPGVYELTQGSRVFEIIEAAGGLTEEAADEAVNMAQILCDGEQIRILDKKEYLLYKEANGGNSGGANVSPGNNFGGANTFPMNVSGSNGGLGTADGNSAQSGSSNGLVNINSADKKLLMTLPGIGAARAEAIIAYREAQGPFKKADDIMKVSGIKNAAYSKIKDKISV